MYIASLQEELKVTRGMLDRAQGFMNADRPIDEDYDPEESNSKDE